MAVCLALVCCFYLSFSLVTRHFDQKAEEYGGGDQVKTQLYLDSIASEKVYFGYTLKECREKEVNLGLDLKGGMSVTMEVSVPDILRSLSGYNTSETFNHAIALAQEKQKSSGADFVDLFVESYQEVDTLGGGKLANVFATHDLRDKITLNTPNEEVIKVIREQVNDAISNSFNVLRSRIDRFGVVQPNVQDLGAGRILIEMPGIKEPERVRKFLQGSANLEFWETYEIADLRNALTQINNETMQMAEADSTKDLSSLFYLLSGRQVNQLLAQAGPVVGTALYADTAAINAIFASPTAKSVLPRDLRLKWTVKAKDDAGLLFDLVALKAQRDGRPSLEGDVVSDANIDFDQLTGRANVSMEMNAEGAKTWQRITGANIGHCVAIVLDDYVYSYPVVQSEIAGGRSQITGNFTVDEAKDLANTLKCGKMPAPARIIQEDVVGPSLGQEAITAGLWSFAIGFCLILIYMIFYYGFVPGLIADLALLLNVFLLVGVLASFSAVLTLPGIAGIVLTMGCAVDGNVLIYERIREEMKQGKDMRKAIVDGYKGAISAIIDANVTSFLTGAILAYFGTGPIKGFAVTYMIGIVTSFLTAVFITRLLLDDYAKRESAKELSFTTPITKNFLQNTHFNFVGFRKVAYIFSGIIVCLCLLGLEPHVFGKLNLGIDFSGGRNYVVRFDKQVNPHEIESTLTDVFSAQNPDGENLTVRVIAFGTEGDQVRVSTNYRIHDNSETLDDEIEALLYEGCKGYNNTPITKEEFCTTADNAEVGIMQSQKVGPSIADDITTSAFWAVLAALLGIFAYILIRFRNWAYSFGGVLALAHDTIIVLGLYALLWKIMPFSMEIDQSFVAAILTVIGYSINDTVVIFDRIREYNTLYAKRDRAQNINDALNHTLSRTFSTSMSTFVVLLAIFCLGGESIQGFVFALLIGVIVGTYSSVFVAAPVAYDIQRLRAQRKERKEQEIKK